MVTPESSDHTTGRLDHPNSEETEEENAFKCNGMKMMETFEEEMKNSLKEMGEKTSKKWKKLINPSKKSKKTKRMSGVEDAIEEIDLSVKENIKSNKFLTQTSRKSGTP